MPAPAIPQKSRQSNNPRPRNSNNRASSKHSVKDQDPVVVVTQQPRMSEIPSLPSQPDASQRLSNVALAGGSSNSEAIIE